MFHSLTDFVLSLHFRRGPHATLGVMVALGIRTSQGWCGASAHTWIMTPRSIGVDPVKGIIADIPRDVVDSTRVYHYIVCRLLPLPPNLETPRLAIQKMLFEAMEPTAGLIEYLKTCRLDVQEMSSGVLEPAVGPVSNRLKAGSPDGKLETLKAGGPEDVNWIHGAFE